MTPCTEGRNVTQLGNEPANINTWRAASLASTRALSNSDASGSGRRPQCCQRRTNIHRSPSTLRGNPHGPLHVRNGSRRGTLTSYTRAPGEHRPSQDSSRLMRVQGSWAALCDSPRPIAAVAALAAAKVIAPSRVTLRMSVSPNAVTACTLHNGQERRCASDLKAYDCRTGFVVCVVRRPVCPDGHFPCVQHRRFRQLRPAHIGHFSRQAKGQVSLSLYATRHAYHCIAHVGAKALVRTEIYRGSMAIRLAFIQDGHGRACPSAYRRRTLKDSPTMPRVEGVRLTACRRRTRVHHLAAGVRSILAQRGTETPLAAASAPQRVKSRYRRSKLNAGTRCAPSLTTPCS